VAFIATRTRELIGVSSTGTKHGLLIEQNDTSTRFTVTGNNGKRHAAVILDEVTADAALRFLKGDTE
jgi:hypothetical protein